MSRIHPYYPGYRYGIIIGGANYSPGFLTNPEHVIMAETLLEVADILKSAASGNPRALDGTGKPALETPLYGEPGDHAHVYRVSPDMSPVIDEPGDRARHAFYHLNPDPAYVFTFGPRGGLKRESF